MQSYYVALIQFLLHKFLSVFPVQNLHKILAGLQINPILPNYNKEPWNDGDDWLFPMIIIIYLSLIG